MTTDAATPEGWSKVTLGEICLHPQYGWTTSAKRDGSGLFLLRTTDISSGPPDWASLPFCVSEPEQPDKYLLRAGDIVVSRAGSVGISALLSDCPPAVFASYLIRFRPIRPIGSEFIYWFLQSPEYWSAIADQQAGIAVPNINASKLSELDLLLPPLAEQKRIVAKVEELLARVNAARERLAKVPSILKRFRQSVLAAACSGQLTADWRMGRSSLQNAESLLLQIEDERKEFILRNVRGRKTQDVEEDSSSEAMAVDWEIPESWGWVPIKEVLHYGRSAAYGVLQPGDDIPDGVPFVRICDLANGTIDSMQIKRIAPAIDRQYPRTRLQGEEVLVTLVGTIGRTAVVPESMAGANVARAVGMLPLCPHVIPKYVRYALAHPLKNKELVDLAREVARKTLNLGLLKAVKIPLPSMEEQHEIVRRVEALFALADKIESHVHTATARVEKITQSILAKAFRGELVPTEAALARQEGRSYEPAAVLLERIRRDDAEPKPGRKGRGRRKENLKNGKESRVGSVSSNRRSR